MELEKRGVPTVTVVTDAFVELRREVAAALGSPGVAMAVVAHPLGELKPAAVRGRARRAYPDIMGQLVTPRSGAPEHRLLKAPRMLRVPGSRTEAGDFLYGQGWTDGLPVVPPDAASVGRMVAASGLAPRAVIGVVPPRMGIATVEKIAANAVMAGCEARSFPAVLAAVQAVCKPEFNLLPMQTTTNPVTPLIIVNGPAVQELGLNAGCNVLGQGWRANATIGRALRFVLSNIGGGTPGKGDKSAHGQPGKFTFCIAENEAASPWEPLHVERGFSARDSTVSVIGVTGTQDIIHYARTSARKVVDTIVRSVPREGYKNLYSGGEPLFVLGPEQAAILGRDGVSKKELKRFIFEGTKVPLRLFHAETVELIKGRRPGLFRGRRRVAEIPIADRAQDIQVVVAGGAGNHSVFLPTWGDTRCVTVKIG